MNIDKYQYDKYKLNPVVQTKTKWKPPNVIESNASFEKDSVRNRKPNA
jgi:hypothetical protein